MVPAPKPTDPRANLFFTILLQAATTRIGTFGGAGSSYATTICVPMTAMPDNAIHYARLHLGYYFLKNRARVGMRLTSW
ncbi:hypothetical protein KC332_g26 [Hortaea werneckii]|nr:hypothetical protein KC332_g26 [Hortaea werneckii]